MLPKGKDIATPTVDYSTTTQFMDGKATPLRLLYHHTSRLPQKQLQRNHDLRIEAKIGDDAGKIGEEVVLWWNDSL